MSVSSPSAVAAEDPETLARKVDVALDDVRGLPEDVRNRALRLKDALEGVHKAGLTRIVRTLKADPRGKELLFELVDDPSVRMLFLMHGLIRVDVATRAEQAIARVRPVIQSHGGDVSLVAVEDGTVYVRLTGSCSGCSMSAATLRTTVTEAVQELCPEISEVRESPQEPTTTDTSPSGDLPGPNGLVQLSAPARTTEGILEASGWRIGPAPEAVENERALAWELPEANVLFVRSSAGLRAYRNACAHQGKPLDGGMIDAESDVITCPWHGFRYACETGECLTAPAAQLEQFPLREENGRLWVRIA